MKKITLMVTFLLVPVISTAGVRVAKPMPAGGMSEKPFKAKTARYGAITAEARCRASNALPAVGSGWSCRNGKRFSQTLA